MSRIISTESGTQLRNKLSKAIVFSIRELSSQDIDEIKRKEYSAFIYLALKEISETVDKSASAWEKRDYWVKADRFRMEWEWSKNISDQLETILLEGNWEDFPILMMQTMQKLNKVKVSPRSRVGKPWIGAWARFEEVVNGKKS
ncbi:MAG: hypothetical protein JEZ03_08290 [Bacteroidales bacterium]|nr:hypothetical protein [Bacteroidales bacterium]